MGTRTPPQNHETRFIFLDSSHRAFRNLGLTAPTWFKDKKTALIRENDDSIAVVGECPPDLLIEFFKLYGIPH